MNLNTVPVEKFSAIIILNYRLLTQHRVKFKEQYTKRSSPLVTGYSSDKINKIRKCEKEDNERVMMHHRNLRKVIVNKLTGN